MSEAIYIPVDWYENPQISKLKEMNGAQGVVSLFTLLAWTAKYRPQGVLSKMSECDIANAAEWPNKATDFTDALVNFEFLIKTHEGYAVRDWIADFSFGEHP
jgi:hypothetical protein